MKNEQLSLIEKKKKKKDKEKKQLPTFNQNKIIKIAHFQNQQIPRK